MKIRKIKKEDIKKIIKIGKSVKEFNISDVGNFWSNEQMENWVESKSDICLIAEENKKIIGFTLCALHVPTKKATWENLWIHQDYRKKDIGKKLLEEMMFILKKYKCKYICGFTKGVSSQKKFFEKNGFKVQSSGYWIDKII